MDGSIDNLTYAFLADLLDNRNAYFELDTALRYSQNALSLVHLPLLPKIMSKLARLRPLFHSEADFQYSFAWELNKFMPYSRIYLERPFRLDSANSRLDIFIEDDGVNYLIELKYKTLALSGDFDGQNYDIKPHGANDHGGYDFIKDICRIERFSRDFENCYGLSMLLTNDSKYWLEPTQRNGGFDAPAYSQFRLNEGRELAGLIAWPEGTSEGTIKGRERSLLLENKYTLKWSNYSNNLGHKNGEFKYLAVEFSRSDVT